MGNGKLGYCSQDPELLICCLRSREFDHDHPDPTAWHVRDGSLVTGDKNTRYQAPGIVRSPCTPGDGTRRASYGNPGTAALRSQAAATAMKERLRTSSADTTSSTASSSRKPSAPVPLNLVGRAYKSRATPATLRLPAASQALSASASNAPVLSVIPPDGMLAGHRTPSMY